MTPLRLDDRQVPRLRARLERASSYFRTYGFTSDHEGYGAVQRALASTAAARPYVAGRDVARLRDALWRAGESAAGLPEAGEVVDDARE